MVSEVGERDDFVQQLDNFHHKHDFSAAEDLPSLHTCIADPLTNKQEEPAAIKQPKRTYIVARKTQKLLPMFPAHRKTFTPAS